MTNLNLHPDLMLSMAHDRRRRLTAEFRMAELRTGWRGRRHRTLKRH